DHHLKTGDDGVYRGSSITHLKKNDFFWVIDPVGFLYTLREIYDRYQLPLIMTDNGLGAFDHL
ncbi:family 1 glycosylhydrolase, partial [Bacillus spizizenii]|nr:family 1 glycosylhydrolase [Bacillus spizizenii]